MATANDGIDETQSVIHPAGDAICSLLQNGYLIHSDSSMAVKNNEARYIMNEIIRLIVEENTMGTRIQHCDYIGQCESNIIGCGS